MGLEALLPRGSLLLERDAIGFVVTENTDFETSWIERRFEELCNTTSRKRWEALLREIESASEEIQEVDALFLRLFALEHTQDVNCAKAEILVRTLGLVGEKRDSDRTAVVQTLALYLGHASPDVRIAVVEALWNIGTKDAEGYIRIALRDVNEWVRRAAETALRGA